VWCPADCDACPTDDRCAAPPPEPEPERCETYVLVTYPHGTAELTADKRKILDEVVAVMKAEPGYQLEILGRTDYTGPRAVNERLSKERATIVYTYLAEHGIEPSRMRFKALWDSDPLRPADPADFKRVNRSTQMKYLCDGEQPESE
jgi:OOP family OmpA-OmpF porin